MISVTVILRCDKKTEVFTVSKGLYLLKIVTILLRKYKIKTWLDAGTLLGVIRDGALIKHDTDVDIATYYDNREKLSKIANNAKLLKTVNLECWRNEENMVSFNIIGDPGTYLDVYLMKWQPKLELIKFMKYTYNVPKNPKSYLKILYGKWKIPKKGKHADPNVHIKGRGVKNDKNYFDQNILCWEAGHTSENKPCL